MADALHPGDSEVVADRRPPRRRELDALRLFVIVGLIFFHSARVFDTGEFYVKNDPRSEFVDGVVGFAVMWAMPLLFVIAGIGAWHSLRSRRAGEFIAERIRRLFIPLVFGTLVVVPPQVWIRVRAETGSWPDYLTFYREFLDVEFDLARFPFVVRPGPTDYFEYGQLWFLVILFGWSLLLIPLLLAGREWRIVERAVDRAGPWPVVLASTGILLLIGVALPLRPEVALWNPWGYLVLIAYGFVFAADPRIGRQLRRVRWLVLAVAVAGFVVFAAVYGAHSDTGTKRLLEDYDAVSIVFRAAFTLGGWCWVAAILAFASARNRTPENPGAESSQTLWRRISLVANEAVLPIYVLHQTVIVAIAYVVVSWSMPAALKYLLLATSALIVTWSLFLLVRRFRTTRFLFGMKVGPRSTAADRETQPIDDSTPAL